MNMSTFRGENFDYYEQLLPAEEWGKEAFVNDWLEGVKEGLGDSIPLRVEVAQKSVIEPLYDDYKECLNLIDEDLELKEDEKKLMVRELNYAMKALLDYEIRFPGDIIQTLIKRHTYI